MNNLIEIKNVTKRYGSKTVLENLNLNIAEGKIIGLLAPNGAGKTTLLKMISGVINPSSGQIGCGNQTKEELRAKISYMPDCQMFYNIQKVGRIIDFYKTFFDDFDADKAEDLLSKVGIDNDMYIGKMSKGKIELLQLMLTLSRKAKLYLLDEPLASVDPANREYIINTILAGYNESATVIISTHLITDIENILDEVIVLKNKGIYLYEEVETLKAQKGKSLNEFFKDEFRINLKEL
ncbi:MAG: ABC transporter ATP-binding protein [Clostridia bacterium]|nr:ABC transporter ATP-binding protein [Clostridia bacterium]